MNRVASVAESADPTLLPPRAKPYILQDVLEKMVHGCRDQMILDFGDSYLRFTVDIDTDTLTSEFQSHPFRSRKGYESVQSAKAWKKHVGRTCGWTWLAINQQGYADSVMIGFDGIEPQVLLLAIASSLEVYVIVPAAKPIVADASKNGKRKRE